MSSELSNLRNQAKLLQKEKESCQTRIAALEVDITNLMKQKQFSPVEISDYFSNQQQIADLQERLKRAEVESMELRSMLASQSTSLLSSINIDNSACQSIIESNNKFTMDITQKMTEKQKLLSDTLLENASLKKSISITEAENAKLTSEVHALKWQIENSSQSIDHISPKLSSDSPKSFKKSEISEHTEIIENMNKTKDEEILKKDSIIKEIQSKLYEKDKQLDLANQTIAKLQTTIVNQREIVLSPQCPPNFNSFNISDYSLEIEQHKEELARARQEIKRLTRKNEESDEKIALYEKKLKEMQQENMIRIQSLSQESEIAHPIYRTDHAKSTSFSNIEITTNDERLKSEIRNIKALCASLRDQNESLKEENTHLRVKANDYKEAFEKEHEKNMRPNALRDEVFRLRDELKTIKVDSKSPYNFLRNHHHDQRNVCKTTEFNRICDSCMKRSSNQHIKKLLLRYVSDLSLKFDFFQTKMQTELDKLEIKFERFETYWNQVLILSKPSNKRYNPTTNRFSQEEFINALKKEYNTIKALCLDYADTQNIPREKIPPPSKLIGDKSVLRHFIFNSNTVSRKHKHH